MSTKRKGTASKPATKSQRAAVQFEAGKQSFTWSNEEWALEFLTRVRLAVLTLQKDRGELKKLMAAINDDAMVPGILDGWIATREHLLSLAKTIDVALNRSYLVLEDLGFTPENPPPDNVVKLRPKA